MGELRRDPLAVVRRVIASGEPAEVTARGRPTGVRLVPDEDGRRSWVRGADLVHVAPVGGGHAERWRDDLAGVENE